MKSILEIYEKFKIMPTLQEHQLRVGAVAKMICDSFDGELDEYIIIAVSLLHDMGNITKFDLKKVIYPERYSDKEINYWENIQKGVFNKYGDNEYIVTKKILKEIGFSENFIKYAISETFSRAEEIFNSNDFIDKIVKYSDIRVAPLGIVSMQNRLKEASKRYNFPNDNFSKRQIKYFNKIEEQIFDHCSIYPTNITEESALDTIEKLKSFEIRII